MHDNPYESPPPSDSVPKRRRPSPPPVLYYGQIVGTATFFGALAGLLPMFSRQLLWFIGATALSLLLALSACVFLELRRREEERKAAERPLRDIQAWRRH